MTLLQAVEEANMDIGVKGLSFANLQEFNAFHVESFNFLDWPRNVVVPFDLNGVLKNNRTKEVVTVSGWILTRINQDTNDWRSVKIEPDFISPMRAIARKFLIALASTDIVDSEVEDIRYTIRSEYMFLNSHLFGVAYTISLPVTGKTC